MNSIRYALPVLALLAGGLVATPLRAAEGYDNCTGFIDNLPATISAQGVWCLRKHLSTAITDGAAITIATNNATIDCNDFKLGGLAAGAATLAAGIRADSRENVTVRRCGIRGFHFGIYIEDEQGLRGGHVIEDNRLDGNTRVGLHVGGGDSIVRRNEVRDTGGSTATPGEATGVSTSLNADVIDNTVSGVLPLVDGSGNATAYGIHTYASNGSVRGNRVRNVFPAGTGSGHGIFNQSSQRVSLRDNHVIGNGTAGYGLYCVNADGVTKDNVVNGFDTGIDGCTEGGNTVLGEAG